MSRVRKAWSVTVKGFDHTSTYYAATGSKARYQAYLDVHDCYDEIQFKDIKVLRNPSSDILLPKREPVCDLLSKKEIDALMHAFGANPLEPEKAGTRDYFYTDRDNPILCALTERGLMRPRNADSWGDGMIYFIMTDAGKQAALSMVPEYRI